MKRLYTAPELEVTLLLASDILASSFDDEVGMDVEDAFGD
jgi:hypothetical protein